MSNKKEKAVLVKHWKELSLFSWFLHLFILFIGLLVVGIVINGWVNSYFGISTQSETSSALNLLVASIAILFGLAPFIHYRFVLFSLSLLFLFQSWLAIETGEIKTGKYCCTIYRESDPSSFYIAVAVYFLIFIAGSIWAWTVKPVSPNKSLQSDAPSRRAAE